MADMRFPSLYDKGCPWVVFTPYTYVFNAATLKTAKGEKKGGGDKVQLFMPGGYAESIGSDWSLQPIIGGQGGSDDKMGAAIMTELGSFGKGLAGAKVSSTASSISGTMTFPTDINVFNGTKPLNVSFNFEMVPIDPAEGKAIIAIIKYFKTKVLPSAIGTNDTKLMLKYPDIWDIDFKGIKGLGIEGNDDSYKDMVLKDVTYTLPGTTNALVFHDGNPVQATLKLTFESMRKHYIK